ncbi:hypothetical protein ACFSVK_23530 [Azorhizophilus paspali]
MIDIFRFTVVGGQASLFVRECSFADSKVACPFVVPVGKVPEP